MSRIMITGSHVAPCWTYQQQYITSSARHRYPHVFTLHYTAHALDLALEAIGDHQFFMSCTDKARKVVQTITNSHAPHAIFLQKSKVRLLKPGKCAMCLTLY